MIVEAGQVCSLQGGPADWRRREELSLQLECEDCQWHSSLLLGEVSLFSVKDITRLDEAHLRDGEQSALLTLLISAFVV